MRLGMPELLIVFVATLFWLVPLAAGIWAIITLQRIRSTQESMQITLAAIQRDLQERTQP